ncbi:GntR family transcriptional regulator [Micromonospora sp. NBC_01655]|uniref:GntR family transcriptional regulator n=1 Tax=Micromonospora sp. NBC_01655 TaxID=2975983 RepID=UPI00224F10A0|nr:GntR family transcriptional regulator [Micromonospora sp. NBC_01655]MCX4474764.1 GntR family transcriptional regulator [Micromonospora sp. NBC_01655]
MHRLAAALRARIAAGEWVPGTLLPAQARIGYDYGVGKATAQKAIDTLRAEGLIDVERGVGIRVRGPAPEVDELIGEPDQLVTARMPTPEERARFGMAEGVPVLVVRQPDGLMDVYPADEYGVRIPRG